MRSPADRPRCPHRPPCPGCPRFGEAGIAREARAALASLCAEAGLPPPDVMEGPAFGYRHRTRLAVRGRSASPKLGVFQEGSHRIVDVPRCLVHHPLINQVAAAVKQAVRVSRVAPYAEHAHRGELRYVQVVVERSSTSAQVVLVGNSDDPAPLQPLASALESTLGRRLHSLWWNGNPARTNTILGPRWHRWSGPAAVCEDLGGARIFFPPGAFGQANLDLFERLVARVASWVPDGARVVEFHAGCGAIALGLLPRVASIAFNEVVPDAIEGLALGLAALSPSERARATVLPGAAAAFTDAVRDADVVIVDPPRRGLDEELLDVLVREPPAQLIAVSCSLDAFLREARTLLDAGRLRLHAVVPVALFPHTAHVETLARFVRA
jgi:tRNA/tmRNA/rRNA uracil-C5-methylase (TrmA/RlmC/RlmD family)